MAEENLKDINLDNLQPEKPEGSIGNIENPAQSFEREKAEMNIEAAEQERVKEALARIAPEKKESNAAGEKPASTDEEDKIVANIIKEVRFGDKKIEQVVKELKNIDSPYVMDAVHDQLMELKLSQNQ